MRVVLGAVAVAVLAGCGTDARAAHGPEAVASHGSAAAVAEAGDRVLVVWSWVTGDEGPQRDAWRLYRRDGARLHTVATGGLGSSSETRPVARAFAVGTRFVITGSRREGRWTSIGADGSSRSVRPVIAATAFSDGRGVLDRSGRAWTIGGVRTVGHGRIRVALTLPPRAAVVSLGTDDGRMAALATRYDKRVSRAVAVAVTDADGRRWRTVPVDVRFAHDATYSVGLLPQQRFAMVGVGTPSYVLDRGGRATRLPLPAAVDDTSVYAGDDDLFAAAGSRLWRSDDLGRHWHLLVG